MDGDSLKTSLEYFSLLKCFDKSFKKKGHQYGDLNSNFYQKNTPSAFSLISFEAMNGIRVV